MYLDNPMSVAYEAAKAAHFGGAPARAEHPRHGRVDHRADGRPDARLLRPEVQPGEHRPGLRRQDRLGPGRRPGRGALRRAGRAARRPRRPSPPGAPAPSRRSSGPRTSSRPSSASPTAPRWRATTATPPSSWRPSSATTPARGSTGPWSTPATPTAPRSSYQDYNQAGAFFTFLSCEPDETQANLGRIADVYRERHGRGAHRRGADPGQEQGPRPERPPERAADGPAASLGFHWTYRREYLPVDDELDALRPRHPRRLRRVLDRLAAPAA